MGNRGVISVLQGLPWLIFLIFCLLFPEGPARAAPADEGVAEGLAFAPFGPENGGAVAISTPETIRLEYGDAPFSLFHSVRFWPNKAQGEVSAKLPEFGKEGETYPVRLSGQVHLMPKGRLDLELRYQGTRVFHRNFRKAGATPFNYPIMLWGGEPFDLRLTVHPDSEGRVENLLVEYPGEESKKGPARIIYYKRTPLPVEVVNRNALRYLEAFNRDLERLSRIACFGAIYLLVFLLAWFFSRRLFKASKNLQGSLKRKGWCRRLSFFLLAACGLLLLLPTVELLYRFGLSFSRDEPAFVTYPMGFNLENFNRIYLERDNFNRFNTQLGETVVPHLSPGVERICYGNYYYRATINGGGFRGVLHPLPAESETVFCIGGSSTYGMNDDGQTFPDYLKAALDEQGARRFAVFNLGVPGLAAKMFEGRAKYVLNVTPDYIIIYSGFNDMYIPSGDLNTVEQSVLRNHLLYEPAHDSLLCRDLLVAGLKRSDVQRSSREQAFTRRVPLDLNLLLLRAKTYAAEIDRVLEYARTVGAGVLYVNEYASIGSGTSLDFFRRFMDQDSLADFLGKSQVQQYEKSLLVLSLFHGEVRTLVKEKGYTHVRCLVPGCFEGLDPKEILFDWVHLTAGGNHLLGEFMADALMEFPAVPEGGERGIPALLEENLLCDAAWTHDPTVTITRVGDSDLIQCSRLRFELSKAIPGQKVPAGKGTLYIRVTLKVNHPMIQLEARISGGEKVEFSMNPPAGIVLPEGEQTYLWPVPKEAWTMRNPIRIHLSFTGSNRDTRILIRRFEAYIQ